MKAERQPGEMQIDSRERDDVLLRRSANGDEEAFTLLYRRHQGPIYRFALRMTGSTWAAEEIVRRRRLPGSLVATPGGHVLDTS